MSLQATTGDSQRPRSSFLLTPDLEAIFSRARQLDAPAVALVSGLSLLLGILADRLFLDTRLGINVPLWVGAFAVALLLAERRVGLPVSRTRLVCLSGALLTASLVGLRASETLQGFNLLATAVLLLLAMTFPSSNLRQAGLLRLAEAALVSWFALAAGAVAILRMRSWQQHTGRVSAGALLPYGRAALLAAPLLIVFGALFVAADAVFEAQVKRLALFDTDTLIGHVVFTFGATWVTAGLFWGFLSVETSERLHAELGAESRLRLVETAIVLGSLTFLFAAFVVVQVRYLFGGEDVVLESVSLTYAQYARRGFFELVAVAALLLPVLLAFDWARSRVRRVEIAYRALAAILVALLFVIMASAFERLRIYEQAFGLTETRLYVAVALAWFGLAFVWFYATVLRGRRRDFASGALAIGVALLLAVNVLNPDALIAARNTDRLTSGKEFDVRHAASLSADAVPTLIANLDHLSQRDACTVARALLSDWSDPATELRSWNLGRDRAIEAVNQHRDTLEAACNAPSS